MSNIDYRALLVEYMAMVVSSEGVTLIADHENTVKSREMIKQLESIRDNDVSPIFAMRKIYN